MTGRSFRSLAVLDRIEETPDAVSLILERPPDFGYKAGQHLPIRLYLGGREERRTYTLSSSPLEEHLKITVKRVQGGQVSNLLNDLVRVGDRVEARAPIGSFFLDCHPSNYRSIYLFAAGSGITPMISILKTVLATEPNSSTYLLYGNRDEDRVIFKDELEELLACHPDRFKLAHALSRTRGCSRAWWSPRTPWDSRPGIIDRESVRWFLNRHHPKAQDAHYFICGPAGMNESVRAALREIDVPEEDIYVEHFRAPEERVPTEVSLVDAVADIRQGGKSFKLSVPKEKTVLQTLLDAGHDPPYSCRSGICGSCRARIVRGEVQMRSAAALSNRDLKRGLVLACQARCTTAEVALDFGS